MPAQSEKQREVMADTDAAYIAGFLDGEGYITIRRSNLYKRNVPSYRLVVGFTNTDISVLQWIQEFTGGCINPKARKSMRHSPAFELTIHNREAVQKLLEAVKPYLWIKYDRAKIGLALLSLGKMKKSVVARGKAWPIFKVIDGEVEQRESMKLQLSAMNRRGVAS